jgi:hypothetical protein
VGTPLYMAPEQTLGGAVDHRADVYAFGVVLYEAVSGANPFLAPAIEQVIELHRTWTPPPPVFVAKCEPRARAALETLIMRCLAKDFAARPASMNEVESVLAEVARIEAAAVPMRRRRLAVALASLLVIVAAYAGYAAYAKYATRAPEAAPPVAVPVVSRDVKETRELEAVEAVEAPVEEPAAQAVKPEPAVAKKKKKTPRATRKTNAQPGTVDPTEVRNPFQ